MTNNIDEKFKVLFSNVDNYFKSLNQLELIGWGLICLGFIFLVLGVIFI